MTALFDSYLHEYPENTREFSILGEARRLTEVAMREAGYEAEGCALTPSEPEQEE